MYKISSVFGDSILPLSTILVFDFGIVPTGWSFPYKNCQIQMCPECNLIVMWRIHSVTMKVQAGSNSLGSNLTYTMIEWAMQANVTWLYWVDTSAGGLLVPEGIIRQVVSALVLTWLIRYIYYCNLQLLNNVIINKAKVPPPSDIGDLSRFWPFGFIALKTLNYLAFKSLDFECTWCRLLQKRVVHS